MFTVEEAARHPHLRERGYIVELEHAELGRFRTLGAPFKLPESPGGPRAAAPLLGQHNEEIYGDRLGLSSEALSSLRADGIV